MATFYKGDNLELLRKQSSSSIDLIYFDPPFGITQQYWDEKLDWEKIFIECFRVLKPTGTLVIHSSVPFNYTLIRASPRPPTYSWYWDKVNTTTPLIATKQPMRHVEEILVWKMKKTTYYPQRVGDEIRTVKSNGSTNYVKSVKGCEKKEVVGKYQTHLIKMLKKVDGFSTRPEEIIELFINCYTKEGDLILDPSCYKGLSGKIAKRMGRRWLGFDKYFLPSELM